MDSPECPGSCCAGFTLDYGFKKKYKNHEQADLAKTADMITFTGTRHAPGRAEYTCKFYNKETKRCMDYENRPPMCSNYPYDGVCGVCGVVGPTCTDLTNIVWCCWTHMSEEAKAEARVKQKAVD